MNIAVLQRFGLTKPQAKAYITLVKNGFMSTGEVSKKISESRTNAYMILEKLVQLGLVQKDPKPKGTRYFPSNPIELQKIVEEKRRMIIEDEKAVKDAMPALLNYFFTYQQQPGVRFFVGVDGIMKIHDDQRRTGQDIHFLRSDDDINLIGDKLFEHIEKRASIGITTYGIEADSVQNAKLRPDDKRLKRYITCLPKKVFTSPVTIYVYGHKVGLISYGEEAIGTIIESPQLARAFKEIFNVIRIASPHLIKEQKKYGTVQRLYDGLPSVERP